MSGLGGRRAVVTGGGSGVGAAIARALAGAGAEVWISGRREGPLAQMAAGAGLHHVVADVTDEASVRRLFETVGPADIVVANAGAAASSPVRRTSLADWNAMLSVNLTGTFLTFREGLVRMPKGRGRLIAIASIMSLRGDPYVAAYAAAKHGVLGLVRSLAKETARDGITVNALCPGYIDTPMTDRTIANIVEKTGMSEAEARARIEATNPMNRLVRPEEVAAAVLWLASDAAAMVTGQGIAISGGEP
jgi:3-hydroxybutyrate dehydrogenase